ncbi:hypothetical protein HVY71_12515 [Citrobacter freundii]|uniref:hypothetical protein n=1 Tax=Citrobacter portucalensis TaxID=1639133 RepID=UPI0015E91EC3|nr:hypothetical protein HVY71_12515 [Citrobacter freundii]
MANSKTHIKVAGALSLALIENDISVTEAAKMLGIKRSSLSRSLKYNVINSTTMQRWIDELNELAKQVRAIADAPKPELPQ